ncbi:MULTISPECIES: hypothetical protein [unclassified Serratia (in: enterobacteria)]|uniref:hypothetical protein n=1 Tax=unclassified Serratia (in: enterobacteria) TaxID=2647522 RepID=UPI0030765998
MKKTLIGRCIRRWKVRFKPICDSKVSPVWRKHHLKGYIRQCALITAGCMVREMAERNAQVDYGTTGWTPEFSEWFNEPPRRAEYEKEARDYLNEEADNDEIDDMIDAEVDEWRG